MKTAAPKQTPPTTSRHPRERKTTPKRGPPPKKRPPPLNDEPPLRDEPPLNEPPVGLDPLLPRVWAGAEPGDNNRVATAKPEPSALRDKPCRKSRMFATSARSAPVEIGTLKHYPIFVKAGLEHLLFIFSSDFASNIIGSFPACHVFATSPSTTGLDGLRRAIGKDPSQPAQSGH